MGNNKDKRGRNQSSNLDSRTSKKLDLKSGKKESLIVISLKDLDKNQGQTLADWQNDGILALAFERLQGLCGHTIGQALHNEMLTKYDGIPSHSKFTQPKHLPNVKVWYKFDVQGKERVIGHIEDNVYYVVFLDKNHEFYPTEKKGT